MKNVIVSGVYAGQPKVYEGQARLCADVFSEREGHADQMCFSVMLAVLHYDYKHTLASLAKYYRLPVSKITRLARQGHEIFDLVDTEAIHRWANVLDAENTDEQARYDLEY